MRRLLSSFLFAAIAAGGAACGGHGHTEMQGATLCANDTRAQVFMANLEAKPVLEQSQLKVKIESSSPALPIKGDNDWIVAVTDSAGAAIDGAAVTITPFMPDHGHGTSRQATIAPMGDGKYDIDRIYLFMPGLWRITIGVTKANETVAENHEFNICIDG